MVIFINIGHFPDKARTLNALRSFLNRESDKDIKLLKTCIDLDRDYKRVCVAKVIFLYSVLLIKN